MTKTLQNDTKPNGNVFAKQDDGSIQITLRIPKADIAKSKSEVLAEVQKTATIPGFRKGKAPISKVEETINQNELVERVLSRLLPKAYGDEIAKQKVQTAMYPKFQVVKAQEGQDWEVIAQTAELPEVDLGDYKNAVAGALKAGAIWTPGKGEEEKKEPTREQKYNLVVKALLDTAKVKIAGVLLNEEVEAKLSQLLARLEKLGVSLESYLKSIGKNAQQLREDYLKQAVNSIKMDLVLNKIAQETDVKIDPAELEKVVKANPGADTPEQRRVVESILRRQAVLDNLVGS